MPRAPTTKAPRPNADDFAARRVVLLEENLFQVEWMDEEKPLSYVNRAQAAWLIMAIKAVPRSTPFSPGVWELPTSHLAGKRKAREGTRLTRHSPAETVQAAKRQRESEAARRRFPHLRLTGKTLSSRQVATARAWELARKEGRVVNGRMVARAAEEEDDDDEEEEEEEE